MYLVPVGNTEEAQQAVRGPVAAEVVCMFARVQQQEPSGACSPFQSPWLQAAAAAAPELCSNDLATAAQQPTREKKKIHQIHKADVKPYRQSKKATKSAPKHMRGQCS